MTDAQYLGLLARVERLELAEAKRVLRRGDEQALSAILPPIAGARGPKWSTIAELRASEHAGLRLVLAGWSSKRLGKLFARATGVVVDGYMLEHGGRSHGAACWRVVGHVGEFESPETPLASSAAIRCLSSSDSRRFS